MTQDIAQISQTLSSAYDEQYSDEISAWREIGGKYKAKNILKVCNKRRFARVLECGAGEGSILKFLNEEHAFSELHAIEISDTGIEQIKKRNLQKLKEVKKFNGYEIPYPDDHFDLAYCSHVIEHVEHPRLLLREMKRVSKFQVFEIPLDYSLEVDKSVDKFLAYGHINIYTPAIFKFLLKSEGYKIINDTYTHTSKDVVRFSWYNNLKFEKTFRRELSLQLSSLRKVVRRIRVGKKRHRESGYNAYTCLAQGVGELEIF